VSTSGIDGRSVGGDFELPVLKRSQATGVRPTVVIDSREQRHLPFERLKTITKGLASGDYSIWGLESLFTVERKSIDDLANCCTGRNRERFERELHRLRGYRFKRLLIVGQEDDIFRCHFRSAVTPKAVLATLGAFEARFDLPVVFIPCPRLAGRKIESWAFWFARESVLSANALLRAAVNGNGKKEVPNGQ
jgi:DNA excision repair protein ERCC-4